MVVPMDLEEGLLRREQAVYHFVGVNGVAAVGDALANAVYARLIHT